MAQLNKFSPVSPDTFLKAGSDMALAKFGHLNAIVDAYNTVDTSNTANANILSLNGLTASTTLTTRVDAISTVAGALKGNSITESTSGAGVTVNGALELKKTSSTTKNSNVTLTAAELGTGLIIWTGGPGTITLPTATDLATQLNATRGTVFEFVIDNTGGSGQLTITAGTNMPYASAITGGTVTTLTNSTTAGIAGFRITFISTTAAVMSRLH